MCYHRHNACMTHLLVILLGLVCVALLLPKKVDAHTRPASPSVAGLRKLYGRKPGLRVKRRVLTLQLWPNGLMA